MRIHLVIAFFLAFNLFTNAQNIQLHYDLGGSIYNKELDGRAIRLNLNKFEKIDNNFNLSVGSEVELTHNFAAREGFYAIPTLAVKWTFN